MREVLLSNIEAERVRHKLSKAALCKELRISQKTYWNYLHGASIPSSVLLGMATRFSCSVDYLLNTGMANN